MLIFVNDIQALTFERFVVTFALSLVERTSPLGTTNGLESRSANLVKLMRNCGGQQFAPPLLLWRLSNFAMFCNHESERVRPFPSIDDTEHGGSVHRWLSLRTDREEVMSGRD